MKYQDEKSAEDYCNSKTAIRSDIPEGAQQCGSGIGAQLKQADPREILLNRLDIAEENLIRQLSQLKEVRGTIRWASPEALRILEQILNCEHVWRY